MAAVRRVSVGVLWLLAVSVSCRKEPAEGRIGELFFQVDSTRIAHRCVLEQDGLSFHPPVGWLTLADTALRAVREQTRQDDPALSFTVLPVRIFHEEASGSLLSVSRIVLKDDSLRTEDFPDRYRDFLMRLQASAHVQTDAFLKDGIPVVQYLIQDDSRVVFKFLLKNIGENWIQFDYIVLREAYSDEVKAIESSVGSIRYFEE